MRAVIQRVAEASVVVEGSIIGAIGPGLLVLLGVERGDGSADVEAMAAKIAALRVFPSDGEGGGFERSVAEAGGSVLVVSQFTLPASLRRGRRPSFTASAPADRAEEVVDAVVAGLRLLGVAVATGSFGAMMTVRLVNEGPATFVVDVRGGRVL